MEKGNLAPFRPLLDDLGAVMRKHEIDAMQACIVRGGNALNFTVHAERSKITPLVNMAHEQVAKLIEENCSYAQVVEADGHIGFVNPSN